MPGTFSITAKASPERTTELRALLTEIRDRVQRAASGSPPRLVAVSKYKPASDVLACYEAGQLDFGENYVQELVEKAQQLPLEIRWHFIGTLQSNKAKTLASIPNLHAIQTVTSTKGATALNKAISPERTTPLNIFIQVNTSGEDVKSGLLPLTSSEPDSSNTELLDLAQHIITACPRLRLQGLMTIGSLTESLASSEKEENADFRTLSLTRDCLQEILKRENPSGGWGDDGGKLLLSMGMSSDFEAAVKSGSDIVRVGTGIFGTRLKKEEIKGQMGL